MFMPALIGLLASSLYLDGAVSKKVHGLMEDYNLGFNEAERKKIGSRDTFKKQREYRRANINAKAERAALTGSAGSETGSQRIDGGLTNMGKNIEGHKEYKIDRIRDKIASFGTSLGISGVGAGLTVALTKFCPILAIPALAATAIASVATSQKIKLENSYLTEMFLKFRSTQSDGTTGKGPFGNFFTLLTNKAISPRALRNMSPDEFFEAIGKDGEKSFARTLRLTMYNHERQWHREGSKRYDDIGFDQVLSWDAVFESLRGYGGGVLADFLDGIDPELDYAEASKKSADIKKSQGARHNIYLSTLA